MSKVLPWQETYETSDKPPWEHEYATTPQETKPITTSAPKTKAETKPGIVDTLLSLVKSGATNQPLQGYQAVKDYFTKNTTNDKLADLSKATQTAASMAVGGIATAGSGPFGGSVAMAGTDAILNKIKGQKQTETLLSRRFPNTSDSAIKATIEGALENEVGGRVIGKVLSGGKKIAAGMLESISPGSMSGITNNTRSYSQLAEKGKRNISRVLEDIFAPKEKLERIAETNIAKQAELEGLGKSMSGRDIDLSSNVADTTRNLADDIQATLKGNKQRVTEVSNAKADAIHVIAGGNNPATVAKNAGTIIPKGATPPPNVNGPIYLQNSLKAAQDYIDNFNADIVHPDVEKKLYEAAQNIISSAKSNTPPSFAQVWKWKKRVGDLSEFGGTSTEVSNVFKDFYHSFDKDIEGSLQHWPNNGAKALDLWNDTKVLVSNKFDNFDAIKSLVNAEDVLGSSEVKDKLNATIANPKTLQKLLNSGDLTGLLSANKNTPVSSIADTNTRKILKGYSLSQIWQNGSSVNADGTTVPDPTKMYNMWKAAENTSSMKMIYSKADRDSIGIFLKDLANVNQKMQGGGSMYLKFRAASAGIGVVGAVADSLITHGTPIPSGRGALVGSAITGAILSAHGVGLLLTNKNTARIMQGMAKSQLDVPAQYAARAIAYALRGQSGALSFQTKDGKILPGKIDNQGKVTIGEGK